jgi:hypothetical protein
LLGDIVLCPQVAQQQARVAGHTTDEELLLLTVHGILHLLGYDHAEPAEENQMFGLQRQLLLTYLQDVSVTDAAFLLHHRGIRPDRSGWLLCRIGGSVVPGIPEQGRRHGDVGTSWFSDAGQDCR